MVKGILCHLAWGIGVYRVNPPGVCGLDGWDMVGENLMVKVCATKNFYSWKNGPRLKEGNLFLRLEKSHFLELL